MVSLSVTIGAVSAAGGPESCAIDMR